MVLTTKSYGYTKGGRAAFNAKKKKTYKGKALTQPEKKQVAQIAKKVVKSNLERKYIQVGIVDTSIDNYKVMCLNPLTAITTGIGVGQRIGERIQNVKLRFKLFYNHGGYNTTTRVRLVGDSMLRVLVIRTKRELTTTNGSWVDITTTVGKTDTDAGKDNSLFWQPDYPYPYNSVISDIRRDNNYEVLYDKTVQSSAGMTNNYDVNGSTGVSYENSYLYGSTKVITGAVVLPQCEYNADNLYLNNKNTYIIVMSLARPLSHGLSNFICGFVHGQYAVEYTDA